VRTLISCSRYTHQLVNCSPALTTLSTLTPQLSYSPPASIPQQVSQHHLTLHSQYPQLSSLSIPYTQASPPPLASNISQSAQNQLQSQSQQQQVSQGTLSPFALHAPQHLSPIPPSSFYTATSQSDLPGSPSQSLREAFLNGIKSSLQSKSFSGGARSVQQLVSKIAEFGILEVSAQTRLDILTKIRDNAGNNYFRAWLENVAAMDITREWLKAGATNNADDQMLETVMPLLHVCVLYLYPLVLSSFSGVIFHLSLSCDIDNELCLINRLRIACLLRVTRLSPPRSAKLCASSPRMHPSRVSTFCCLEDTFLRAVQKLGFRVWVAIYAPVVIIRCA
jgi:hypothetical protein